ncbi:hypothetical protein PPYR_03145 [Photinus pyralis]|uniref:CRAL-TRIO domain-containing protein n=2 Tax=Photinus pyralis TaxID=7054 RepID=A0A5N4A1Z5_PHOPY|nr:alpha-tocopherol transfer protein-like [Photinus pyralis]KAB0791345.1 hypothetical protein PPYR_03145 [Photinus pyralis]
MKLASVEDEYRKNKNLHVDDVKSLQAWVQKQPHLPPVSDLQLALFLHSCYWSMEQAKTTIEKFLTYRGAWPDFFANRNPNDPKVRADMKVTLASFLPSTTAENYKIVFHRLMDSDVDKFTVRDTQKIFDMCVTLELMQKGTFDGYVIICDMSTSTMAHTFKTDILATKRMMMYMQEALPVRLRGVHLITMSAISNVLMSMVKPFMKKELTSLLHFHDSYESLFKLIPREVLPADVGGQGPTTRELHENMQKTFIENADFFVEQESFISNESLRDCRPSYMDQDLGIGIGGSFKRLDLD